MAAPPFVTLVPPDLPNMPDVSNTLSQYLRTFRLWCRKGFADKLSASQALPGIMLQAVDDPTKVFMVQVNAAGAVTATPMALGSGRP